MEGGKDLVKKHTAIESPSTVGNGYENLSVTWRWVGVVDQEIAFLR